MNEADKLISIRSLFDILPSAWIIFYLKNSTLNLWLFKHSNTLFLVIDTPSLPSSIPSILAPDRSSLTSE